SVMHIYQRLCTEERFPSPDVTDGKRRTQRQQNLRTSLRYLAEAFGTSPERLELTPDVEGTYQDRLRAYLQAQEKGYSTIRNTIQDMGQYRRPYKGLPKAMRLPQQRTPRLGREEARQRMNASSPYSHYNWMRQTRYYMRMADWPDEVRKAWEHYRAMK